MRRHLLVVLLSALAACSASDSQPVVFVAGDDFSGWPWATVGGGGTSDLVAYTRPGTDGYVLRVIRVDPLRPGAFEGVTDVPLDALPPSGGITASGNTVAVVAGTGVTIVDVAGSTGTLENGLVTITSFSVAGAERAAVDGGWVLVSSGATLTLAPRAGGFPSTYTAPARVTALVPMGGTFLAFTEAGYVHVTPDPDAPAFVAVEDGELRAFRAAFPDQGGTGAIVAGPSLDDGRRSRVLHLLFGYNSGKAMVLGSIEVDGTFSAFASDGGSTSVLRVSFPEHGTTDDGNGYRLQEGSCWGDRPHAAVACSAFTATRIPLPAWGRGPDEEPGLAARAGHLFALSGVGMGYYRLAR